MDNTIKTITVSNGDAKLPAGKRNYLVYSDPKLVPCTLDETDDGYSLNFDLTSLTTITDMNDTGIDKFRLLSNCRELIHLCSRYEFSLSPENIYFDSNLIPRVLMRDYGSMSEEEFLKGYRALIASVLNGQYSFIDYYSGGEDLYKKDKTVNAVVSKESPDEMSQALISSYDEQKSKLDKDFVYVDRNKDARRRILLPIVCVLLVLSIIGISYLSFFKIPFDKKLLDADDAFLNGDYLAVQTILADVDLDRLPYMTKYILAVSYLKSVDLDQESKRYELAQITPKTEETRFDFWIHIGRLEYEEAIDDAQRLNSDRHLFYAYVGYRKYVENNLDLSGGEKETLLGELDSKINSLREKLMELQAEETVAETAEETVEETVEETSEETAEETSSETEIIEETSDIVSEDQIEETGETDTDYDPESLIE